ncbi:MAG: cytochrome c3 family protein [Geobacteraceae bacterium]|nr:cytochrome c3 family protein [Geobacteraceae bacterium]
MNVLAAAVFLAAASPALAVVGGGDVTMKNKGGDVAFSHEAHVEGASLDCRACHADLYTSSRQHKKVSMKEMQKGKSCGACHDGKKAFSVKENCSNCHKK